MASLSLRNPDDIKRLFSALGEVPLTHEGGGLSLADIDQNALSQLEEIDWTSFGISLLVTIIASWTAVKGFERHGAMSWGLMWGALGSLFPVPALAYTAYVSR